MARLKRWRVEYTPGATIKKQLTIRETVDGVTSLTTANLTGALLTMKSPDGQQFTFSSAHGETPTAGQGRLIIDNVAKTIDFFVNHSVSHTLPNRAEGVLLLDADIDGAGRWPFTRVKFTQQ